MAGGVVLVAQDCFPSLHFLLAELAQQIGFVLRTVAPSGDRAYVTDDEMVAAWGPDVRLAPLIWVTSTTSYRCDLDRLLAHGRMRGSLVGNKDFHFAIYRAAGNPVLVGQFEKLWLRAGPVPAFWPKSCCSDIRPGVTHHHDAKMRPPHPPARVLVRRPKSTSPGIYLPALSSMV